MCTCRHEFFKVLLTSHCCFFTWKWEITKVRVNVYVKGIWWLADFSFLFLLNSQVTNSVTNLIVGVSSVDYKSSEPLNLFLTELTSTEKTSSKFFRDSNVWAASLTMFRWLGFLTLHLTDAALFYLTINRALAGSLLLIMMSHVGWILNRFVSVLVSKRRYHGG